MMVQILFLPSIETKKCAEWCPNVMQTCGFAVAAKAVNVARAAIRRDR